MIVDQALIVEGVPPRRRSNTMARLLHCELDMVVGEEEWNI